MFAIGCKKETNRSAVVSSYVDIYFNNNVGKNLLDSTTQNYFSADNIKVYNWVDGVKNEVYDPRMDFPRNFWVIKDTLGNNCLRVYLNDFREGLDTTLLELNSKITDTITCEIDKSNGNTLARKIWYNDSLEWAYGVAQVFTVVKKID